MKNKIVICALVMLILPLKTAESLPGGTSVESYDDLVRAIRKVRSETQQRIEQAVEQEKVREAWETGKLIDTHVLKHQNRAEYGEQVLKRLSDDLGTSHTELKYMLQFARVYPIGPPADQLSWSHYRELLSLNDSKEREEVAGQAAREGWGRDRVREEVRRRQAARRPAEPREPAQTILTAEPGKPGTYRIVKAGFGTYQNQTVADLGFSNYYRPRGRFPFKEGEFVTEKKGKPVKLKDAQEKDLFTFRAHVIKVIDGDTFAAVLELGFGFTTVQTLRLRALDAPEIESAEGREAKEFLASVIASLPATSLGGRAKQSPILIRTHRSDKYDRYLADVFVNGEYVNQKLVEQGLAVPVSE